MRKASCTVISMDGKELFPRLMKEGIVMRMKDFVNSAGQYRPGGLCCVGVSAGFGGQCLLCWRWASYYGEGRAPLWETRGRGRSL